MAAASLNAKGQQGSWPPQGWVGMDLDIRGWRVVLEKASTTQLLVSRKAGLALATGCAQREGQQVRQLLLDLSIEEM